MSLSLRHPGIDLGLRSRVLHSPRFIHAFLRIYYSTKNVSILESLWNLRSKSLLSQIPCEHESKNLVKKKKTKFYLWMQVCGVVMSRLVLVLAIVCVLFVLYEGTLLDLQHFNREIILCFISTLETPSSYLLITLVCFVGGLWLKRDQFIASVGPNKGSICSRCHEAAERVDIAHHVKQQFIDYVFRNIQVPFNDILLEIGHENSSGSGKKFPSQVRDLVNLLQLMINCGERLTNALDDLGGKEQREAVPLEVNRDEFDLIDLIKLIAWGLKDQLDQKQICLQVELDDDTNQLLSSNNVICDKERFIQTLGNLLSIAIKLASSGGELQLGVRREDIGSTLAQRPPVAISSHTDEDCENTLPTVSESCSQSTADNYCPRLVVGCSNILVARLVISLKESNPGPSKTEPIISFLPYCSALPGWEEDLCITDIDLGMMNLFIAKIGGKVEVDLKGGQGSNIYFSVPFPLVQKEAAKVVSAPLTTISCKHYSDSWHVVKEQVLCSSSKLKSSFLTSCYLESSQQDHDDENESNLSLSTCPSECTVLQAALCKKKILLVEDTEMNRIILRRVLENRNLDCHEAENGQVAVDLHKQGRSYDLVLMDKEMPVMDGYEATRQLRTMGVKTPIVALTGNALEHDKELFLEAGVDDFQTKPLSKDKLLQVLARYIDSS